MQRIQKRERSEEKHSTVEYLHQIHSLHERWLSSYSDNNCKIIEVNADVDENQMQLEYQRIENFIFEIV